MASGTFIASMAMVGLVVLGCCCGAGFFWQQQRGEKAKNPTQAESAAKAAAAKDLARDLEAARREEAAIQVKQCSVQPKRKKAAATRNYVNAGGSGNDTSIHIGKDSNTSKKPWLSILPSKSKKEGDLSSSKENVGAFRAYATSSADEHLPDYDKFQAPLSRIEQGKP